MDQASSKLKDSEKDTKDISKISKKTRNDVLILNVGGKKTTVKRSTLTQIKGSLLDTMFNSSFWEEDLDHDREGNIFLDFDPLLFDKIVYFLRARLISSDPSSVPLPMVAREDEDNFKGLISFLRLNEVFSRGPSNLQDVFESADNLKIVDNGVRVEKLENGDSHGWVRGKEVISKGEQTWRFKIEDFSYWMLIGVINANENMIRNAYSLPSMFGWGGHANEVYVAGVASKPGWVHWTKGQEVELTLDCTNRLLKLNTTNGSFMLNIRGDGPWKLCMDLYKFPTKVLLL